MDMSLFWISIITAVIGGLILVELAAWSPRLAIRLTSFAAGRLPICRRARFREEWLAYLADMPTGLSKFIAALGFVCTAERDRVGHGLQAFRAIGDYFRIRVIMRPYLAEARAFGGEWLALRLKLQPCGNWHFTINGLFPVAVVPFIKEYGECLSREAHEKELNLLAVRTAIIQDAQRAIDEHGTEQSDQPFVSFARMTGFIPPKGRDPHGMRILVLILWKWRQRKIRRTFSRA